MKLLKKIWYEVSSSNGRYAYFNYLINNIPGVLGRQLRGKLASIFMCSCGVNFSVHRNVTLQYIKKLTVGRNVQVGQSCFIQASGGVTLHDDVMLGPDVKIWSVNHIFDRLDLPIYEQGYTYEPVEICKGVWIGANVFIMPGVTLPEGCVVSAGSFVNKKRYKPYSILSGNPCRMIGTRIHT